MYIEKRLVNFLCSSVMLKHFDFLCASIGQTRTQVLNRLIEEYIMLKVSGPYGSSGAFGGPFARFEERYEKQVLRHPTDPELIEDNGALPDEFLLSAFWRSGGEDDGTTMPNF